jgi:hypothetical protein
MRVVEERNESTLPEWDGMTCSPYHLCQKCQKTSLLFEVCLIDQEDRNVVDYGINAVADAAFELVFFLVIGQRGFAGRAGQDFQQVAVNHNALILSPVQDSRVKNRGTREAGIPI